MAGFGKSQAVCENVHRAMASSISANKDKAHVKGFVFSNSAKQQQNAAATAGFQAHVGMLHKKHRAVKCG